MKNIFTFLLLLLVNHLAICQWSTDPTINNPVCTDYYSQNDIQMIPDGSGGAIIAWLDFRFNPKYSIFVQRINSNGVTQWIDDGNQVFSSFTNGIRPSITTDGKGGAFIVSTTGGDYGTLLAQHISADGQLLWGEDGIIICAGTSGPGELVGIANDGNEGAFIAWSDNRNGEHFIYAQHVNSNGLIQWAVDGLRITNTAGYQGSLEMEADGTGAAIITWQDGRSGTRVEIYAQKINGAGNAEWTTDGVLIHSVEGGSLYPQLISKDGGAIICWTDRRKNNNNDWDIYVQKVNNSGVIQWLENGVPVTQA